MMTPDQLEQIITALREAHRDHRIRAWDAGNKMQAVPDYATGVLSHRPCAQFIFVEMDLPSQVTNPLE